GSDAPTVELEKVRYRYEINLLEQELADFRAKKALYKEVIAELEKQLSKCEEGSRAYQEIASKISTLDTLDEFKGISLIKNNILALDQTAEETKYREGDSTLHASQIDVIHELDKWMFSQAKDVYKDKNFMSQLMGCTMRERLAMYLCVEMDKTSLDDALLLFSQTNYLPNIKTIQKKLVGRSPFRKVGWQRIHWGSMRGAFEFVSKKSAQIGQMAKWAKEGEDEAKLNLDKSLKKDELFKPNGENTTILKEKAKDEASKAAVEIYAGEELDNKVCEYSAKILRAIYKMQKGVANRKETSDEMKGDLKMLSALVERKADLSKDQGIKKVWNRLQTATNVVGILDYVYYGADGAASVSRTMGWLGEEGWVGKVADHVDFAGLYLDSFYGFMNCLTGAVGLINTGKKREVSGSAVVKEALAELKSLNTFASATHLAITTTGEFGSWAEGYRKYRTDLADKINERVEKGLSAYEFDTSKAMVRYQMLGSAITVGSAVVDVFDITRSSLAARSIKKHCENRKRKAGMVDKQYREKVYQKSLARLTNRLNARKGLSTTASLVSNGLGYTKYFLPTAAIGTIAPTVISFLSSGIDSYMKKKSDYAIVDEFIDFKTHIADYKAKHPDVDVTKKEFRKQFRKRIILQLGFANTKTFFVHVAERLGAMIHNVLKDAKDGNEDKRKQAEPFVTIVRSMGLRVNYDRNRIPSPKQIAGKLSA
ncbi:MAG: hypothetical protein MJ110_06645, partial [Lachnospiraceae bacterium]|nr:hypothetical protein [Lachnospiraceae bacterium]